MTDGDAPRIAFSPAAGLSLAEGDPAAMSDSYTAVLTARPTGTVTVAVSSDDAGLAFDADDGLPGDQGSVTFSASNWNTARTVSVRAVADGDAATEEATLTHAATGGGYGGVSAAYEVRVSDAEAAPAPTEVSAESAGPTSLLVRWTASPGAQGYWVQWRAPGEAWSLERLIEVPATGATAGPRGALSNGARSLSARIDGLRTGVEYEVRVLALKRGDPGDPSYSARATPGTASGFAGGNRAPELAEAPGPLALELGGATELDLAGMFRDPDGDALSYSASSSDSEVALASVSGATLRVEAGRPGLADVAVEATDPQGLSALAEMRVEVVAPLCQVEPAQAPEGGTAVVVAELAEAAPATTTVRWRAVGDDDPATADADAGEHGDASGEVAIAAGARCAEIEIAIADDGDAEPAREWFAVELELGWTSARLTRTRVPVAVLEGVCDRTSAVREALLAATGSTDCAVPTPAHLARVRTLALADAGLAELALGDLGGLPNLRTLDLRGNALAGLPPLPASSRLERLLLGGNALPEVPLAALPAPERLRDLDLSDNALAELPARAFGKAPGLRALRLDGNGLEALPDSLFAGLDSLRLLRLDGNPGAPFAVTVELERTDAEPWAPPPARVRVAVPIGAPFDMSVGLAVEGGTFAAGAGAAQAPVAAGATTSASLAVHSDDNFVRVSLATPDFPQRLCLGEPCWRGFELVAGEPLALFVYPLRVLEVPTPEPLFGEPLRVPLAALAVAGEPGGELEWSVRSSDASLVSVRVVDGELLVTPEPGAEGVVTVEATATDRHGQTATVRFEVRVEFHWPSGIWRILMLAD